MNVSKAGSGTRAGNLPRLAHADPAGRASRPNQRGYARLWGPSQCNLSTGLAARRSGPGRLPRLDPEGESRDCGGRKRHEEEHRARFGARLA